MCFVRRDAKARNHDKTANAIVAAYPPDDAIVTLGSIPVTDAAGRNTYRNRVIAAYFTAIDAHYAMFVRDLSRSGKGLHVGFVLATVAGGARNSFDRELFAEKALPILISLMDSRRLEVRADILRSMSKPEQTYTLEAAFSDLMRYEAAGTIDGALSDAATRAGERAKESQYDFSKAKDLCTVDAGTDKKRRDLMSALEDFERKAESKPSDAVKNRQEIQNAAKALGIDAPAAPVDRASAFAMLIPIRDQIEAQCDGAAIDALRAKITTAGVALP